MMVIKILGYTGSALEPLQYNNKKYKAGEADVLSVRNCLTEDYSSVSKTFRKYENSPYVDPRINRFGIHIAFNPGVSDKITPEQCLPCIDELMTELGYGKQPYVVFRHHDIERVHYHIVSVRVTDRGHAISNSFDYFKGDKAGRRLGEKYGFVMGKEGRRETETRSAAEVLGPSLRFDRTKPVREQLRAVIDEVQKFDYETPLQLKMLLLSYGVTYQTKEKKNGKRSMLLSGADEDGTAITRPYPVDGYLRRDIVAELESIGQHNHDESRRIDDVDREMGAAIWGCCQWAHSEDGLRSLLRCCGYESVVPKVDSVADRLMVFDKGTHRINEATIVDKTFTKERLREICSGREDGRDARLEDWQRDAIEERARILGKKTVTVTETPEYRGPRMHM